MTAQATFPRPALFGALAVLGISLMGAAAGRVAGPMPSDPPPAAQIAERTLQFTDQPDGGVAIVDAESGAKVATVAPGTNGFLRALLRGLARERKRDDYGSAAPFRLTAWADGRITLDDTTTSQRVDLEAFGPTNAAVFARLLTQGRDKQ